MLTTINLLTTKFVTPHKPVLWWRLNFPTPQNNMTPVSHNPSLIHLYKNKCKFRQKICDDSARCRGGCRMRLWEAESRRKNWSIQQKKRESAFPDCFCSISLDDAHMKVHPQNPSHALDWDQQQLHHYVVSKLLCVVNLCSRWCKQQRHQTQQDIYLWEMLMQDLLHLLQQLWSAAQSKIQQNSILTIWLLPSCLSSLHRTA